MPPGPRKTAKGMFSPGGVIKISSPDYTVGPCLCSFRTEKESNWIHLPRNDVEKFSLTQAVVQFVGHVLQTENGYCTVRGPNDGKCR